MGAIETIEPGSQPPATRGHQLRRLGKWVRDLGPAVALVLLVVFGIALNPSFLSWGNLSNVLTRSAFIGIISIGATFVIVTGAIDLDGNHRHPLHLQGRVDRHLHPGFAFGDPGERCPVLFSQFTLLTGNG